MLFERLHSPHVAEYAPAARRVVDTGADADGPASGGSGRRGCAAVGVGAIGGTMAAGGGMGAGVGVGAGAGGGGGGQAGSGLTHPPRPES